MLDNNLVSALKNRDESAMGQLYDRYSSTLLGIISQLVGDQQKEEEILQSCFMKAWKTIDTYKIEQGSLFVWLSKIARSLSIDEVIHMEQSKTNRNNIRNINPIKDVNQNLNSLKKSNILNLVYFKGQDYKKVAQNLNITTDELKIKIRSEFIQMAQLG